MAKKKAVALVMVALLLGAGSYWIHNRYFTTENTVIQAAGTIEATSVDLNSRMAGTIEKLTVKSGETVKKGQLVARLARNDLKAQRERDALGVLKAEASLADLTSGAREQEKNEAAAHADIARANFARASNDFNRAESLLREGAISQAEFEKLETALEQGKNQLKAAESKLSLLEAGSRPQLINAARAEVERSRAILKSTEAMLEDLNIYAPIDGVVLTRNYEEGEFIQMGASVATLANLGDLWINLYIPTDDLPHIKLGQKVNFTVSGTNTVFAGVVEEIASKGEYTPKTIQTKKERTNVVFAVKIGIKNEGGVLKPGMPADVAFQRGLRND